MSHVTAPKITLGVLLLLSTLGLTLAAQDLPILPEGARVAGLDLGGLGIEEARALLLDPGLDAPDVTVRTAGHTWTVDARELGWRVDSDATLRVLAAQERSFFQQVTDRLRGVTPPAPRLFGKVDSTVARAALDTLTAGLASAPRDATVAFANGRYVVRPENPGQRVDTAGAAASYAGSPDVTALEVPVVQIEPTLRARDLTAHVEEGNRLVRPLVLRVRGDQREMALTGVQVADLFWVRRDGIELDERTLRAAIDRAARTLGRGSQDARFVARAGKLVPVAEQSGLGVDREAALHRLREAVLDPEVRALDLPVTVQRPALTRADLPDPAELTLLAKGSSRYLGSNDQRVANVSVAAAKLNGYVIPKGGEFSFLRAIGRITAGNGFKSALVISGGRTVEGIGGGVCQVSTTVFRAMYSAGLPVVERHQHAYRVRWYEPQVGFEAAVYDPGVDLRLTNDTDGPLLIRVMNDTKRGTLDVKLYGRPTPRQVTVSPAVVLSRTPAPAALTVVNAALRPGQRRQVDWAADGYDLFLTRTITDATGTRTEKLSTRYKAWRAVFEVGPTSAPPAEKAQWTPSARP